MGILKDAECMHSEHSSFATARDNPLVSSVLVGSKLVQSV